MNPFEQNPQTRQSDGQSRSSSDLEGEAEKKFAARLQELAGQIEAPPSLRTSLEKQLLEEAHRRPVKRAFKPSGAWQSLAYLALIVGLSLGLIWSIRNLLPGKEAATTPLPVAEVGPDHTAIPILSTLPSTPPLSSRPGSVSAIPPGATTQPIPVRVDHSSLFPNNDLILQATLPPASQHAAGVVVHRLTPGPTLSLESVQAMAASLGVQGFVYDGGTSDNPAEVFYTVSDGIARVDFSNSPDHFFYARTPRWYLESPQQLTFAEQVAIAQEFLLSRNLLGEPFQVISDPSLPETISFIPSLDGLPVYFGALEPALVQVRLDSSGQVSLVAYQRLSSEPLGTFPIISAEQAWEMILTDQAGVGIETSQRYFDPGDQQVWQRTYPNNERVELFATLSALTPLEDGAPPYLLLDNYPLTPDSLEKLQGVASQTYLQVWGTFSGREDGLQILSVEDWLPSPSQPTSLRGQVQRQDAQTYLLSGDQSYLLPDLPGDVPEGMDLVINGVILPGDQPAIHWISIVLGEGATGGGGGIGSGFRELNLSGAPQASPTPTSTPFYQADQRLEGTEGLLFVSRSQASDGSLQSTCEFYASPSPQWPDGLQAHLEGDGLAGIELLNHLPVRIWGELQAPEGPLAVVLVESYEPVYPGAIYTGWIGTLENVTIEGQAVNLFTSQAGEQFILQDSINQDPDPQMGNPGDLLLVEGYSVPGEQFGGYPVLRNAMLHMASNFPEPAAYLAQLSQPMIIPPEMKSQHGAITIDSVELVYVVGRSYDSPSDQVYLQPVWRFNGRTADGQEIEIRVQALAPEFLR